MQIPVIDARCYLPPKDKTKPNDRIAYHPETNGGQVLMPNGKTLNETLGPQMVLADAANKPTEACLWLKVCGTD